ncbi:hypothetical protein HYH02_014803 [Chlamydomonas schloesseri]|uniref:ubiquitinyl hydrolase 1 n=1 Tax=Chlamydomonas schloesseri TaxID=2026947 RepID=A0A835STB5_9CHLO|nr:hypothetical protein HYH02_014803 [Chlamydomonas schloesseri]|eukprot:KAG2426375.1 hypothetical protein HYH02_014803 [Chlamydomonas schloesseri]
MLDGGNAWAWSGRGPELAQNYWEAINDRRATGEELEEAIAAAAAGGGPASGVAAPVSAQWACLGCGQSKGDYKTCGKCKLAAYCSRECQQKHWPRHKPQCHQLVEADKERQAKGAPKPAAPTPDPPLTLSRELIFSRDGYASLLEAHVANRAVHQKARQQQKQQQQQDREHEAEKGAVANGWSGAGSGSDNDKPTGSGSAREPQGANSIVDSIVDETGSVDEVPATAAGASSAAAGVSADISSAEAVAMSTDPGPEGTTQAPDGSWHWVWTQPPSAGLLTPAQPTGIFNTGNSCYAASAIQALLATPALGEWLRSGSHCTCCPAPDDKEESSAAAKGAVSSWCPACELSELAAEAAASAAAAAGAESKGRPSTSSSPQPVNAGRLTKQVARLGRTLRPGRQEDAHELLMKLLEALADIQVAGAGGRTVMREKARATAKAAAAAAKPADGGTTAPAPLSQPVWRGDETSLVHHCLAGYLRRAIICSCCGHISQSHEPMLSLEVHLSTRVHSVEAGLKSYFEDEVLDEGNEYRCERCRQLVCATRRVRLEAAPNVLIIGLKRFTALHGGRAAKKDNKPVALKLRLDLAPHMAPEPLDDGPVTYRLYAVVQHTGVMAPGAFGGALAGSAATSGTLNMGHYVAVVRGGDGNWYCCDDDEVTMVPESEVAAIKDAYLLFYEREQPRLPPQPQPPAREDVSTEATCASCVGEELGEEGQEQQAGALASQWWEVLLGANNATSPGWQEWLAPDAGPPTAAAAEMVTAAKARSGSKAKGQRKQAAGAGEAAETSSSASSQRAVVCPRYTLRPPRRQGDTKWELQVEMPGVRSRDVKLATTSSQAQQEQQPSQAAEGMTASSSVQPVQARVRTWAAGWYNLDLELQLQWAPGPGGAGRWEVVVSPAAAGGPTHTSKAAATSQAPQQPGIEVGQPVWNNSRKVLKVPVRVLH